MCCIRQKFHILTRHVVQPVRWYNCGKQWKAPFSLSFSLSHFGGPILLKTFELSVFCFCLKHVLSLLDVQRACLSLPFIPHTSYSSSSSFKLSLLCSSLIKFMPLLNGYYYYYIYYYYYCNYYCYRLWLFPLLLYIVRRQRTIHCLVLFWYFFAIERRHPRHRHKHKHTYSLCAAVSESKASSQTLPLWLVQYAVSATAAAALFGQLAIPPEHYYEFGACCAHYY